MERGVIGLCWEGRCMVGMGQGEHGESWGAASSPGGGQLYSSRSRPQSRASVTS